MPSFAAYVVGDVAFTFEGEPLVYAVERLAGFRPFRSAEEVVPGFSVQHLPDAAVPSPVRKLYGFDSEEATVAFFATDKGHLLQMRHANGEELTLWTVADARQVFLQGTLNPDLLVFALWTAYGLMTVGAGRIALHSSCIVQGGEAYLFLGESGTGKSTHTRLWRQFIPGSTLLNDDSPIVAVEGNQILVYGSPWSGKTPCYQNACYPLGACVRLEQAPANRMDRLRILQAYAALHPSCPPLFAYDERLYEAISRTLDAILSHIPCYHLACLPDEAAARLSYGTLHADET